MVYSKKTAVARASRRGYRVSAAFGLVCMILLLSPAAASATTWVPQGGITTNTEWTTAGSPYVIDSGGSTVNSGVTLTIDPGVVVKFESSATLAVYGTLSAVGTSGSRITFTSIEDDTVAGDTSGDGTTSGSPGDWNHIAFLSSGVGSFDYSSVRYGAVGSTAYGYGAIYTQDSASVTIDHGLLTDNQSAGALANGGTMTISHTESSYNGDGFAEINATFLVDGNSSAHDNSSDGLFIDETGWTGSPPSVTRSSFENNGGYGVALGVSASEADAYLPVGNYNNIDGNSAGQLYVAQSIPDSDWTNNYWGGPITFVPCNYPFTDCTDPSGYEAGYLAPIPPPPPDYWEYPATPPQGPVSSNRFHCWLEFEGGEWVLECTGLDFVTDDPFESSTIDNSGY